MTPSIGLEQVHLLSVSLFQLALVVLILAAGRVCAVRAGFRLGRGTGPMVAMGSLGYEPRGRDTIIGVRWCLADCRTRYGSAALPR